LEARDSSREKNRSIDFPLSDPLIESTPDIDEDDKVDKEEENSRDLLGNEAL